LEKQKKGEKGQTTPLALLCHKTLSRSLGKKSIRRKKILLIISIPVAIPYSNTTATSGRSGIWLYINFGLPFFAPFFWRSKRKEKKDQRNTALVCILLYCRRADGQAVKSSLTNN
jgi:hypothetical protein